MVVFMGIIILYLFFYFADICGDIMTYIIIKMIELFKSKSK